MIIIRFYFFFFGEWLLDYHISVDLSLFSTRATLLWR